MWQSEVKLNSDKSTLLWWLAKSLINSHLREQGQLHRKIYVKPCRTWLNKWGRFYSLWWGISSFNIWALAPHSSTLAWKIPWTEEPGRLQSTGSLRVDHNWATSLSLFTFMHWRRKWQPTPVFLPGESQGRGSLVGCCLWCRIDSDTTEAT